MFVGRALPAMRYVAAHGGQSPPYEPSTIMEPDMPNKLITTAPERRGVTRRTVLRTAVAAGGVLALGGLNLSQIAAAAASVGAAAMPATAPLAGDTFVALSRFLTGHADLNTGLAPRFLDALRRHDATIDTQLATLWSTIQSAKLADMDAYMEQLSAKETALTKTAQSVVLAWYLGIVGTGPKAELITYADALMYRPSHGITAIPSYGEGPDSWGKAPPADAL